MEPQENNKNKRASPLHRNDPPLPVQKLKGKAAMWGALQPKLPPKATAGINQIKIPTRYETRRRRMATRRTTAG
jgi:hypothetical protein